MLPYCLLLLLIVVLGLFLCERKPSRHSDTIFLGIVSLALILFAALRADTVGIDYPMYQTYFERMHREGWQFLIGSENEYRIEFGFSLLNYIVSLFSGDVRVLMAVMAVLIVVMATAVLYRDGSLPWVGMFVFVSFNFFGNSMSFIRQSLAIGIFLFAIRYLKEKRFVPYLLILLLAASFHKSMLLLLPFYFLAQLRVTWKSVLAYVSAAAVLLLLFWPIFTFVTQFVYQFYATEEGLYFLRGRNWQTAFIPVTLAIVALLAQKFLLERSLQNVVLVNFALYTGLLFFMTCQHYIFQRIGNIFFASAIFLVPELLKSIHMEQPFSEEVKSEKRLGKEEKKKRMQEQRKWRSQANWHKYYYRYSLGVVLFLGTLYYIWFLLQNRINLIPYLTFL